MLRSLAACFAAACAVGVQAADATMPGAADPVPSLTPAATETLWRELVSQPRARPLSVAAAAACTPTRVVFYAPLDWRRLATKLAATPAMAMLEVGTNAPVMTRAVPMVVIITTSPMLMSEPSLELTRYGLHWISVPADSVGMKPK